MMFWSILGTWLYLMIPCPVIMAAKNVTAVKGVYWAFQTVTTVGLGDITLDTEWLKVFVTMYSPIGMMIAFLWKRLLFEYAYSGGETDEVQIKELLKPLGILALLVLANSFYWGPRFKDLNNEGNWFVNGYYFTVNTISTIGYGDLVPNGPTDYFVFIMTIAMGIPIYFYFIGKAVAYFLDKMTILAEHFKAAVEHVRNSLEFTATDSSGSVEWEEQIALGEGQDGPMDSDETFRRSFIKIQAGEQVSSDDLSRKAPKPSMVSVATDAQDYRKMKTIDQMLATETGDRKTGGIQDQLAKMKTQKKPVVKKDPFELAWDELHKKWQTLLDRAEQVGPQEGDAVQYGDWHGCRVQQVNEDGSIMVEIAGLGVEKAVPGEYEWTLADQGYKSSDFPDLPTRPKRNPNAAQIGPTVAVSV